MSQLPHKSAVVSYKNVMTGTEQLCINKIYSLLRISYFTENHLKFPLHEMFVNI